ncbi:acyl carrier protein [Streptomyces sp. CB00455]|uniref:acyl carrier protein n=1 Tax=Streptomyces sp. CB00455 TaxID=1703927 RepID=UPI00093FAF82|nr:acyl carrier protein [Streptomyces sp. CB00455]
MTTTRPTGPVPDGSVRADEAAVLADLTGMIEQVLGEYGLDDTGIAMETRFGRDLELESIDLVTLAGLLEERYGRTVNFAEFVASMELEEIIELSVGRLVEYVCLCLKAAGRD